MSEPEVKRPRIITADGPVENEEIAIQKMKDAQVGRGPWKGRKKVGKRSGFDPKNVTHPLHSSAYDEDDVFKITPMGYFASEGDLPMMRWLYSKGASTRDLCVGFYFPMYCAAVHGHLDVCKWLYDHEASQDIKRKTQAACIASVNGLSPLRGSSMFSDHQELMRWLILKGALCTDDGYGELDMDILKQELGSSSSPRLFGDRNARKRALLLEWANDLHQRRGPFRMFLLGTSRQKKHSYPTRKSLSPIRILGGQPGVLQVIGDFVGIVRGREARIIRQLTEVLPDFNRELEEQWHRRIESLAFRR